MNSDDEDTGPCDLTVGQIVLIAIVAIVVIVLLSH